MHDELLQALDNDGNPLPTGVSRIEAHRYGIWHRSVSIFVVNPYGEILLEKRSPLKDLFPGLYDIPGGHLTLGQTPLDASRVELKEELGLDIDPSRLKPLCPENGVIERVVIPEKSIINLERKTIYLLQIFEEAEEEAILSRSAEWLRLSPKELEERGVEGEVSHVEFWSWARLEDALRAKGGRVLASGTETALSHPPAASRVRVLCYDLQRGARFSFWEANRSLFPEPDWEKVTDECLLKLFLERPSTPAGKEEVEAIFELGTNQTSGAYQIGPFRLKVSGDKYWGAKLRDPATHYVDNLLKAIAHNREADVKERLLRKIPTVRAFVGQALNLPMGDGSRLRDRLSNLADIEVARKAVLVWLEYNARDVLSGEDLLHPTRDLGQSCIEAGRSLLANWRNRPPTSDADRIKELLLLGLGASIDFNNPRFQAALSAQAGPGPWILKFIQESTAENLSVELGGGHFLQELFDEYLNGQRAATLAFLPGNCAQAYLSLAFCQELLEQNKNLRVMFIPKSGAPGNDLGLGDAQTAVRAEAAGLLAELASFEGQGRFIFIPNGPTGHGLDPARLSRDVAEALGKATVIIAEGQAYAEICGWKKPTYIAFRVNGRVAEAIHGVSRTSNACALVRLTPGVDHFEGFETAVLRRLTDRTVSEGVPAALQTTSEYVSAILGDNLPLVAKNLFQEDLNEAIREVRTEARRLDKTFAQVLLGAAGSPPDPDLVKTYYKERRFPVFGCGGGGGFNGVTLKALRMLGKPVAAGVPSTDDGGSTGDLQSWLRQRRGFVFGVGDMAGILQDATDNDGKRAVLAYRLDHEPSEQVGETLAEAVLDHIKSEISKPTYPVAPVRFAPDFLSFVCDQLNLARIIDRSFRSGKREEERLRVRGASLRNLNVVAAYELCNCLGDRGEIPSEGRLEPLYVLEKALGITREVMVLPVTYDECVLYLEYEQPVESTLAEDFKVPGDALREGRRRLLGQKYIDKLPQRGKRRTVGVVAGAGQTSRRPKANPEYLARLRAAELFVMGAGSLVGSQLAQLAVDGVVETLISHRNMRKILVINHVKLDETLGMTLRDQIELIETVATEHVPQQLLERLSPETKRLRIGDIFTDVVIPRTVAREVQAEMFKRQYHWDRAADDLVFVELQGLYSGRSMKVLRNRYVDFLLDYPEVQKELAITLREIQVLSYLEQPGTLFGNRTETGRYRGALFAADEDIDYLVERGIQRRSIHEVDSIGENWKFLKAEGAPSFETFPGLVPEALVGIFRIALERGSDVAQTKKP